MPSRSRSSELASQFSARRPTAMPRSARLGSVAMARTIPIVTPFDVIVPGGGGGQYHGHQGGATQPDPGAARRQRRRANAATPYVAAARPMIALLGGSDEV